MDQQDRAEQLRAYRQKGSNQMAVRSYNERLMLQLIREQGEITKADATRATGLSPNAVSVIFRSLEDEKLVLRGEPIRGRIGQPSVPVRINPEAHKYVALKIGRRSLELAVVDFVGQVRSIREIRQPYPTPQSALDFVRSNLTSLLRSAKSNRKAITSMAIAIPSELWSWTEEFDAPTAEMETWRDFDPVSAFEEIVPWSVVVENDGTAACRGECVFGSHSKKQDWLYLFVGTFIGGGVVLNGSVFPGRRGNAGGFGPMRVPEQDGGERLVDHASLVVLEHSIAAAGGNPFDIYEAEKSWDEFEPHVTKWIERAGRTLAHAIVSSLAVMDFEAAVIDGAMPDVIRSRLVDEVKQQLAATDLQGVHQPVIEEGQIGRRARVVGAAAALVNQDYLIDQNTLLRN